MIKMYTQSHDDDDDYDDVSCSYHHLSLFIRPNEPNEKKNFELNLT